MKVKPTGFADKMDTGFRKRRGMKTTPGILIRATGRMRLPFIELWKTGEGRVSEKIKKSTLDIFKFETPIKYSNREAKMKCRTQRAPANGIQQ